MSTGHILIVCTGNVCRSPYMERRLTAELGGTGVNIVSAGTAALVGSPMDREVSDRLSRFGSDTSGFAAGQLTSGQVRQADLVLGVTRSHRSEVVRMEPKGLQSTFAVADFADLASAVDLDAPRTLALDTESNLVRKVVAAAVRQRARVKPRAAEEADIVDPYRQSARVSDQMVQQTEVLLPPIVQLIRSFSQDTA